MARVRRRAPDYSSHLCPPKMWSIWLFQLVFLGLLYKKKKGSRPKTPPKKSYRSYFRRAQIRWVVWRSSSTVGGRLDHFGPARFPTVPQSLPIFLKVFSWRILQNALGGCQNNLQGKNWFCWGGTSAERNCPFQFFSASLKRGCLNVGAWNPQESGRKAPLSCNAAFSMLQCSFSFAAAQRLVQMTSALQKSECCSAVPAAQHSENCSATSVFACGSGVLEGWGLGLADWERLGPLQDKRT